MQRQLKSYNNIPSFLQWSAPIARFLRRLYLASPSHPGQSTTLLWLERPSRKCAKLPTVAPSNNKNLTSCSSYFCLFVPHGRWFFTHISYVVNRTFTTTLRGCNACSKVGLDFLKEWEWKSQVKCKLRKLGCKLPAIKLVKTNLDTIF